MVQIAALRAQEAQAEEAAAANEFNVEAVGVAQRLAQEKQGSAEWLADLAKLQTAWQQLQDQLTKIQQGALKQREADQAAEMKKLQQQFDSVVSPIVSTWTQGMLQMAEGAKSFQQVMLSIGNQVLNDFVGKVIDPMIESWLWGQARQTVATLVGVSQRTTAEAVGASAGNAQMLAQTAMWIKQDAAKTFGGLFSAFSQNPVTAPAAPAIASAGAAAVLGFAYAEQGWGQVPIDNAPTLLHKNEMVLPASIANPMRGMLNDFNSGKGFPMGEGGRGSGDTHNYAIHVHTMDAKSFDDYLMNNHGSVMKALRKSARSGAKMPA